ncbi:MAG: type I-U CRISPR-associated protein Cas8c [Phycisphaerales bacterium]|jgi:CRISPR-associated protein Csb3|nr:type I-U CRISPR-associated protein Cas8c [Phycisphaerales bacterium]
MSTTTLTLDVDLTNPGQFLACCGLLELASRVDSCACGFFNENTFIIESACAKSLRKILFNTSCVLDFDPRKKERIQYLKKKRARSDAEKMELKLLEQEERVAPLVLKIGDAALILDWWKDESVKEAGFKTWSGAQTPKPIIDGMLEHIRTIDDSESLWKAMPILKPKPFYYDSRMSRLTAIDSGFSTKGFVITFSPAVELLALVSLQRFRPSTISGREYYGFATWSEPLSISVAAAVMHGLVPVLESARYRFPLVVRTGGKYKAFGPALKERTNNARIT